jgi:hypothetical protein
MLPNNRRNFVKMVFKADLSPYLRMVPTRFKGSRFSDVMEERSGRSGLDRDIDSCLAEASSNQAGYFRHDHGVRPDVIQHPVCIHELIAFLN